MKGDTPHKTRLKYTVTDTLTMQFPAKG